MPTSWTKGDPKREAAWQRAKAQVIDKHGTAEGHWAEVMGIAKKMTKEAYINKEEFLKGFFSALEKRSSVKDNVEFTKGFLEKVAFLEFKGGNPIERLINDIPKEIPTRDLMPGLLAGGAAGILGPSNTPMEAGRSGMLTGALLELARRAGTEHSPIGKGSLKAYLATLLAGGVPGFLGGVMGHGVSRVPRALPDISMPRYQQAYYG